MLDFVVPFFVFFIVEGYIMGGKPDGFKPKGALFECFLSVPQFRADLEILVRDGFVKVTGPETCEWLKSKTSLTEYFKWAGGNAGWVPGGFWAPISMF